MNFGVHIKMKISVGRLCRKTSTNLSKRFDRSMIKQKMKLNDDVLGLVNCRGH